MCWHRLDRNLDTAGSPGGPRRTEKSVVSDTFSKTHEILLSNAGSPSTDGSDNLNCTAAAPAVAPPESSSVKSSTTCTNAAADEGTPEKTIAPSSSTPQQPWGERQRRGSGASDRDSALLPDLVSSPGPCWLFSSRWPLDSLYTGELTIVLSQIGVAVPIADAHCAGAPAQPLHYTCSASCAM